MKNEKIKNSILYIFKRAEVESIAIGKTLLMKLLYLLDVEIYRTSKESYTGIEWVFYKYGPYSFDLEKLFKEIDIIEEVILTKRNKFFSSLKIEDSEKEIKLDIKTKALIEKLVEKWGTADLNELLDYVYFETEPMWNAKFKDQLDFSTIKPRKEEKKIEISQEGRKVLGAICGKIKNRLDQIKIDSDPLTRLTPEAKKHPLIWEDEIKDLTFLKGKVKIRQ